MDAVEEVAAAAAVEVAGFAAAHHRADFREPVGRLAAAHPGDPGEAAPQEHQAEAGPASTVVHRSVLQAGATSQSDMVARLADDQQLVPRADGLVVVEPPEGARVAE